MTRFWLDPVIVSLKTSGATVHVAKTEWPGVISLRYRGPKSSTQVTFCIRGNARDRRRLRRAIQRYFNEGKR